MNMRKVSRTVAHVPSNVARPLAIHVRVTADQPVTEVGRSHTGDSLSREVPGNATRPCGETRRPPLAAALTHANDSDCVQ